MIHHFRFPAECIAFLYSCSTASNYSGPEIINLRFTYCLKVLQTTFTKQPGYLSAQHFLILIAFLLHNLVHTVRDSVGLAICLL